MKQRILGVVVGACLIVVLVSIVLREWHVSTRTQESREDINALNAVGIVRLPRILAEEDIHVLENMIQMEEWNKLKPFLLNHAGLLHHIYSILGPEYVFQDYLFVIRRSQFHTCHRDYNGDFFNKDQKYPSYTMIVYLEEMGHCLDVIPESHKNAGEYDWNWTDYTETVQCGRGDALLFDANLVHGGSFADGGGGENHSRRIQLKISHREDMSVLDFFNGYEKVMDVENTTPEMVKQIQKRVSCQFPGLSGIAKGYDINVSESIPSWIGVSIFAPLRTISTHPK